MNRHDDVETRISSWLQSEARGELPDWVLRATFEQTRTAPQQRGIRGWLAARRHGVGEKDGPRARGRSSMFSMTRIAAVLTVVTMGVAAALYGGVLGPDDRGVGAPGAESTIEPGQWAFFDGTLSLNGYPIGDSSYEESTADGLVLERQGGYAGQTLRTGDPRMTGTHTYTFNADNHDAEDLQPDGGLTGWISSNRNRIVTADGDWLCTMQSLSVSDRSVDSGWCVGEGGHEGLKAYLVIDGGSPGGAPAEVFGYITAGDGPPPPEAPAE